MTKQRSLWIGVDQTGATRDQGQSAVPLPMAWVRLQDDSQSVRPLRLEIHATEASRPGVRARLLRLPTLTPESLEATLRTESGHLGSETALLLDCVLGLPEELLPPGFDLWSVLKRAAEFPGGYGRAPAEAFFQGLLHDFAPDRKTPPFPARRVERALRANSVFQSRPYQRNIQTGTYRMWRELGRSPGWLTLWPLDRGSATQNPLSPPELPVALEGYPSYLWRSVFNEANRAPERCISLLQRTLEAVGVEPQWMISPTKLQDLITASPDHADALILAVGGFLLDRADRLFPREISESAPSRVEGWIAGAPTAVLTGL